MDPFRGEIGSSSRLLEGVSRGAEAVFDGEMCETGGKGDIDEGNTRRHCSVFPTVLQQISQAGAKRKAWKLASIRSEFLNPGFSLVPLVQLSKAPEDFSLF